MAWARCLHACRAWCLGFLLLPASVAAAAARPNILWITSEDNGPHLGCYGDPVARTPHLDALAARGVRYRTAWSTVPVCAPARTALLMGMYPTSLGAEHMRSLVSLPSWMSPYPRILRDLGYHCTNNSKEDYNVRVAPDTWNESSTRAHWRQRPPESPFFAVFNFTISHESQIRSRPHVPRQDPARVRVPAYHPDVPEVRRDWAQYYDKVAEMDAQAGAVLRQLEEDGLVDDTIIFYYGDHGSGMPRSKRWPYDSGLRVPLIVVVPEKWSHLAPADYIPGGESSRLVEFVDFAPTVISLAGSRPPWWMQGRSFMGRHEMPARSHVFGMRGRMDERLDLVRSVRDGRYIYIRNYMPHLIYGQHLDYMFQTPTTRVWREMYDAGKLVPPQTAFWEPKPVEELYDLEQDPDEVRNLADDPAQADRLRSMRRVLRHWMESTHDLGFLPEADRLARAGEGTLHDMGRNAWRYPLMRVLQAAELASETGMDKATLRRLGKQLGDRDAAVRYWAAIGCLRRGPEAVLACRSGLETALGDASPSVAVAAAWALGRHGSEEMLGPVLTVLARHVDPVENGVHLAVHALNAADDLGDRARPLLSRIQSMPKTDPAADRRLADYVLRLSEIILARFAAP